MLYVYSVNIKMGIDCDGMCNVDEEKINNNMY